jgi:hypothetical protein
MSLDGETGFGKLLESGWRKSSDPPRPADRSGKVKLNSHQHLSGRQRSEAGSLLKPMLEKGWESTIEPIINKLAPYQTVGCIEQRKDPT